ncbi:MAG: NAD(P)/FAD-dependent oxidoreductase, partial [Planctomycetota bacterium]|nr:NAD(P)/FAD-dependent oxidoreductase [Planctomycetota bacterium]
AARFAKRSLDARGRGADQHHVCQVDVAFELARPSRGLARELARGAVREAPIADDLASPAGGGGHVVVVGAGPGGLFAALAAALSGARVTLVERGDPIETRGRKVVAFHRGAEPDPETNLLFGDGGAGTYSDGKLYTRTSDRLEPAILRELVAAGAPEEIAFDARAHIGTDRLHRMLPRLRARLEASGVRFEYGTRVVGLDAVDDPRGRRLRAVRTSEGELELDALVLAIGHSARDTWETLSSSGVQLEAKPFKLGVRIEHPQELVTRGRYGEGAGAASLGPASYNLQSKGVPPAHSFCMCPGGRIVASVNEGGRLCTNGMSNSKHSSRWANAALVTTFAPEDFEALGFHGPLAGVALQRALEERFFVAGGSTYAAPAQRARDFLEGRSSGGELATSYGFGAVPARVDQLLPPRVRAAIGAALLRFERAIPGFSGDEGLLVGVETRSSGPVRMVRDRATRLAVGWTNLLPAGEGAGYAGGIMSAAIDGARSGQVGATLAGP